MPREDIRTYIGEQFGAGSLGVRLQPIKDLNTKVQEGQYFGLTISRHKTTGKLWGGAGCWPNAPLPFWSKASKKAITRFVMYAHYGRSPEELAAADEQTYSQAGVENYKSPYADPDFYSYGPNGHLTRLDLIRRVARRHLKAEAKKKES